MKLQPKARWNEGAGEKREYENNDKDRAGGHDDKTMRDVGEGEKR